MQRGVKERRQGPQAQGGLKILKTSLRNLWMVPNLLKRYQGDGLDNFHKNLETIELIS